MASASRKTRLSSRPIGFNSALDTATDVGIRRRSAGLQPGVSSPRLRRAAGPEAGVAVAVSISAHAKLGSPPTHQPTLNPQSRTGETRCATLAPLRSPTIQAFENGEAG